MDYALILLVWLCRCGGEMITVVALLLSTNSNGSLFMRFAFLMFTVYCAALRCLLDAIIMIIYVFSYDSLAWFICCETVTVRLWLGRHFPDIRWLQSEKLHVSSLFLKICSQRERKEDECTICWDPMNKLIFPRHWTVNNKDQPIVFTFNWNHDQSV